MKTQELKQYIDRVLGNSIRCLLPSYWWKRLFNQVADRIDEVEQSTSQLIDSKVEEVKMPIVESVDELSKLNLPKGSVAAVKDLVCSFKDLYRLTEEDFDDVISNIKKTSRIERIAVKPYVRVPEDFSSCMCALITRSLMSQITFIVESQGDTLQVRYFETTNSEAGMIKLHNADGSINKEAEEQLNSILKEREYRFVGNPNGPTTDEEYEVLDSIFTIWEASDLYIKGASWERLAKEGENSAIIIYADETSKRNADAFYKIKELAEKGIPATNVVVVDGVAYSAAVSYGEMMGNGVGTGAYIVMAQYAPIDTNPQRTIVTPRILMLGINKDTGEGAASVIIRSGVDSELSDTSENAVQNKAIKAYVDEKVANIGGTTIREFYIGDSLTDEQKAWNLETAMMVEEKKCTTIFKVTAPIGILPDGTTIPLSAFVDRTFLYVFSSGVNAAFVSITIDSNGNSDITVESVFADTAMSSTSTNAVQNKAVKAYVDEQIAAIGEGVEFREFYISSDSFANVEGELTEQQKAYNIETVELVKRGKAVVLFGPSGTKLYCCAFGSGAEAGSSSFTFQYAHFYLYSLIVDKDGNVTLEVNYKMWLDSELSETSGNAIQNKVVTAALNEKADKSDIKTLNGVSLLGGGNLQLGDEQTFVYDDTELMEIAKDAKADALEAKALVRFIENEMDALAERVAELERIIQQQ